MKRARPKNKRAAVKKARIQEEQLKNSREIPETYGNSDGDIVKGGRKVRPAKKKRKPLKLILTTVAVFIIIAVAANIFMSCI